MICRLPVFEVRDLQSERFLQARLYCLDILFNLPLNHFW